MNISEDKRFEILMQIAYSALIEEMHVRSERILRYHYAPRKVFKPFIHPSMYGVGIVLPAQEWMRKMDFRIWGNRDEKLELEYKQDCKRMEDLIPIAEMLETWFETQKKAKLAVMYGSGKPIKKSPPAPVEEFLGRSTKKPHKKR